MPTQRSNIRRDYMTMLKRGYQKQGRIRNMWKQHPVKVADDNSAIVDQNKYGVLIDLKLAADALWENLREREICNHGQYYDSQKYSYMIWSDLECYLVGVVEEQCGSLKLTLIGYDFTEEVTLDNVIEKAALSHQHWSRSSLDPFP